MAHSTTFLHVEPARHLDAGALQRTPDLHHLFGLCDSTGILQHATFSVPCRAHGYCTDDAARALVVAATMRGLVGSAERERLVEIEQTMLSFLLDALVPERGLFRNFMSYNRSWLDGAGSDDSWGRAMWGLGVAAVEGRHDGSRRLARQLFDGGRRGRGSITSLRAWAYALLGYSAIPSTAVPGELHTEALELVERLMACYSCTARPGWIWCEPVATYDNAIVPLALLRAGRVLGLVAPPRAAQEMGEWLFERQTAPDGTLSLFGNSDWSTDRGEEPQFDQQPLDAASLAMLAFELWRESGEERWWERGEAAVAWFRGENDLGLPLIDLETGGCRDGLTPEGLNLNQGAESTLAWLMARHAQVRADAER